jgi:tetratricopeptide (TPR) repeat protein
MADTGNADFDRLWNFAKPEETEARFRSLLPEMEEGSGPYIELLTQIARTEGLQRRFDDAHATLDRALDLLGDSSGRPRVRYLLERGRAHRSAIHSVDPEKAREHFLGAWELARAIGEDGLAVDAAHMMAIAEPGDEAQMEWNLRALEVAESSTMHDANAWCGSLYNNIGWTHHAGGRFDEALEIFIRAQHWREEHGSPATIRIAKWCVARTLRSLGRVDEALAIQSALHAEFQELGEPDGYVFEELGECLLLLGRTEEARPLFQAAHEHLSKNEWLVQSDPARIERLRTLGGG